MLELEVKHQEQYSRGELLLRLLFGWLYIYLPHMVLLLFIGLWAKVLWVYSAFYILLKGQYPQSSFNYFLGLIRWLSRLHLAAYNLKDGYPALWLTGVSEGGEVNIPYNESPNRLWVLIRFLVGPILILPHLILWTLWNMWSLVLTIVAFWVVLFTGKYPKSWFDFNISTLRWIMNVLAYQLFLTEKYPAFWGQKTQ